jgi:hypothetical protein
VPLTLATRPGERRLGQGTLERSLNQRVTSDARGGCRKRETADAVVDLPPASPFLTHRARSSPQAAPGGIGILAVNRPFADYILPVPFAPPSPAERRMYSAGLSNPLLESGWLPHPYVMSERESGCVPFPLAADCRRDLPPLLRAVLVIRVAKRNSASRPSLDWRPSLDE